MAVRGVGVGLVTVRPARRVTVRPVAVRGAIASRIAIVVARVVASGVASDDRDVAAVVA